MTRKNVPPMQGDNPVVQQFLQIFLIPRETNSPEAIRARLLKWIEQANNPARYAPEPSNKATTNVRRKARQNIRRIVAKYPAIAEQLRREQGGAMNFSGWVAMPRTILNNTHTGKLSNNEQLVLMTLMLLADARTGSGHINAAAIRTYMPELNYDTAKRVLSSLEDKRHLQTDCPRFQESLPLLGPRLSGFGWSKQVALDKSLRSICE